MNLERVDRPDRDETVWRLRISDGEMASMQLDPFDRLILNDCAMPDATIADTLLGLELIARRIEQAEGGHE